MVSEDQTATVNFSLVKVSVGAMGVFDISWNSKKKDLQFTISIRKDSDASGNLTGSDSPVAAAHVNATLTYDSSGNNKMIIALLTPAGPTTAETPTVMAASSSP